MLASLILRIVSFPCKNDHWGPMGLERTSFHSSRAPHFKVTVGLLEPQPVTCFTDLPWGRSPALSNTWPLFHSVISVFVPHVLDKVLTHLSIFLFKTYLTSVEFIWLDRSSRGQGHPRQRRVPTETCPHWDTTQLSFGFWVVPEFRDGQQPRLPHLSVQGLTPPLPFLTDALSTTPQSPASQHSGAQTEFQL